MLQHYCSTVGPRSDKNIITRHSPQIWALQWESLISVKKSQYVRWVKQRSTLLTSAVQSWLFSEPHPPIQPKTHFIFQACSSHKIFYSEADTLISHTHTRNWKNKRGGLFPRKPMCLKWTPYTTICTTFKQGDTFTGDRACGQAFRKRRESVGQQHFCMTIATKMLPSHWSEPVHLWKNKAIPARIPNIDIPFLILIWGVNNHYSHHCAVFGAFHTDKLCPLR